MRFSGSTWSRRSFLRLVSSALVIAAPTGCGFGKPSLEDIAKKMIGILNHPDQAILLGSLYIDETPGAGELTLEQWTMELLSVLNLDYGAISADTLNSLETRFREQVRQDFSTENVVVLQGYLFSKTEILLCSLAAAYTSSV